MNTNVCWHAVGLACLFLSQVAIAGDTVMPGDFFVERPTLVSLGFRWYVSGDDNRNATVEVSFRAKGEAEFHTGLPFLRINGETSFQTDEANRWSAPNMLAGSILDLQPGTEYEVRLALKDPDGSAAEKIVTIATRAEPKAFDGGRKLHVYPADYADAKEQPSYTGLVAAYAQAQLGDIILVHRGVYRVPAKEKQNRIDYVFDKTATAERPIVFRAAGDGEAVLDGDGALQLIDCQRSQHHGFEGLTFRNADHLLYAGRTTGAQGLFVRRCKLADSNYPIFALHPSCRDFYIADNVFEGKHPNWHPHGERQNDSHAIWIQGQGHAICYNRIHSYWDGIDLYGRKPPEERELQNAAVDFYNNEISACGDDGIELDYGMHNIRAFRNLIYNTFMGISAQPVNGGPAYVFRNVVYNSTRSPLKPNQYPSGLLVFHNTFLGHGSAGTWAAIWQNSQIHNNLFVGSGDNGRMISTGTLTPETSRLDYNGWRVFESKEPRPIFWKFAKPTKVPTGSRPSMEGTFRDLAEFAKFTGYEQHAVTIDYGDFVKATPPSGENQPLPSLDLRLQSSSKAIDAGLKLSNINDGFRGQAPDLGAYEAGSELPHYGPRNP